MTVRFVSAVDGNNANGGTSWADAKQTVAGALAISAAGDFIKVDSAGTFTANTSITWTPPAGQISIVSVNRAGSDAWLAGAAESVGAANSAFTIAGAAGSSMFVYGMTVNGGTNNSSSCDIAIMPTTAVSCRLEFWTCTFDLKAANVGAQMVLGATASGSFRGPSCLFRNCTFTVSGSRAGTAWLICPGIWELVNPTFSNTGGTKPAILFAEAGLSDFSNLIIRDGDISGYSTSSGAYFDASTIARMQVLMKNLRISATPALTTGTWAAGGNGSIMQRNVDSGNTLYVFQYNNAYGTLTESTSIYAANGALFNGAGISWQIVTTSACAEGYPFISPQLMEWNTLTSSQTVTIEFIRDSATKLTDRDAWFQFEYATSSSFPNYVYTTTENANPFIGTAVTYSTSSTTWTGTGGFTTPSAQMFTTTFTAAAAGLLGGQIVIGKASETVYVDPKLKLANNTSATRWTDIGALQEAPVPSSNMLTHPGMAGGMRG